MNFFGSKVVVMKKRLSKSSKNSGFYGHLCFPAKILSLGAILSLREPGNQKYVQKWIPRM